MRVVYVLSPSHRFQLLVSLSTLRRHNPHLPVLVLSAGRMEPVPGAEVRVVEDRSEDGFWMMNKTHLADVEDEASHDRLIRDEETAVAVRF